MIRVLIYVVLVFLLAAGFAWLAERPGEMLIVWQGYEIRTSVLIAAMAAATLLVLIALVGAIARAIVQTPRSVGQYFGARKRDRGYRALSRGMIAVGAGDPRTARRAAEESRSLLGAEPLVLLLSAQAAQIAGDAGAARAAFEALSASRDTRLLGLHGLFVEARRQGDQAAARHFAEEAMLITPRIAWAGAALFDYQCRAGDWQSALTTLTTNADAGTVERARATRLRAVLLTARALELESGHPDEARPLAIEAHRLAPDLTPAAVTAARLLTRNGEIRRAARLLEAAWKASPHPEIAEAYAAVRPGDSVRDRLKRVRRLADLRANHTEGAIAVARAAIDARDWQAARNALGGLPRTDPTERVCLLMAEIEEGEHADQARVRAWLKRAFSARRDPVWTADGRAFEAWAPVSPVSGKVDAFEWRLVEDHLPAVARNFPLLEEDEPEPPIESRPVDVTPPAKAELSKPEAVAPPSPPAKPDASSQVDDVQRPIPSSTVTPAPKPSQPPLPDDPGPPPPGAARQSDMF